MNSYLKLVRYLNFKITPPSHIFNLYRSTVTEVGNINTWDFARPGAIQAIGIMSFGNSCFYLFIIVNIDLHYSIRQNIFKTMHTHNHKIYTGAYHVYRVIHQACSLLTLLFSLIMQLFKI